MIKGGGGGGCGTLGAGVLVRCALGGEACTVRDRFADGGEDGEDGDGVVMVVMNEMM